MKLIVMNDCVSSGSAYDICYHLYMVHIDYNVSPIFVQSAVRSSRVTALRFFPNFSFTLFTTQYFTRVLFISDIYQLIGRKSCRDKSTTCDLNLLGEWPLFACDTALIFLLYCGKIHSQECPQCLNNTTAAVFILTIEITGCIISKRGHCLLVLLVNYEGDYKPYWTIEGNKTLSFRSRSDSFLRLTSILLMTKIWHCKSWNVKAMMGCPWKRKSFISSSWLVDSIWLKQVTHECWESSIFLLMLHRSTELPHDHPPLTTAMHSIAYYQIRIM